MGEEDGVDRCIEGKAKNVFRKFSERVKINIMEGDGIMGGLLKK